MLDLSLEPGAGGRAFQPADLSAGFLGALRPGERLAGALRERPEVAELLGGGLLGGFGHLLAPGVGCGHVPPRPRRAIAGCQTLSRQGSPQATPKGAALDWPRRRGRTGSAGCPHPTPGASARASGDHSFPSMRTCVRIWWFAARVPACAPGLRLWLSSQLATGCAASRSAWSDGCGVEASASSAPSIRPAIRLVIAAVCSSTARLAFSAQLAR